jgi:subtilisin family serine protease
MPTRKTTKPAPAVQATRGKAGAAPADPRAARQKTSPATGTAATRKKAAPAASAATRSATPRQSLVIYVHGIGQHPAPDALKLQWDLALFGKDLRERSRMAYWADLLHPVQSTAAAKKAAAKAAARSPAAKKAQAKAAESRAEAPGPADATGLDIVQLLAEAHVDPDTPGAEAFAHDLLQVLGAPPQPLVIGPGKKLLPLPPALRRPLSRAFLKAFVADTAAYFFGDGVRDKIRRRLLDVLKTTAGQPVTLVAHSQGSIVAYEVLSALGPAAGHIEALVTIGSPLGIAEVQDWLDPDDRQVPSVVRRWHNFADPLDPVAMDKRLGSDFDPASKIQDELIINSHSRRVEGFNPHSAVGYLAHPGVRRVVHAAMRMDVMAPFVLARDVAERLDTPPEQRHPVLIEVLEPGWQAVDESASQMQAVETKERAALAEGEARRAARRRADEPVPSPVLKLEHRIQQAASMLEELVDDREAARIDPLRRFVAARLNADELQRVAHRHRELRVYAVWQSARKSKLTHRSLRVLKADAAFHSFSADGDGITWAVLDTGVQANHPHFTDPATSASVISAVWDCTQRGKPRRLDAAADADGHGTHVAGIIAGDSRRPGGPRGVAPRAKLVVYKVLDDQGQGEDAWIIKALDHIAEQNENVTGGLAIHGVNLSLGGPFDHTVYGCGFSPICAELRRLWRAGVLAVVACGNEGLLRVQTPDGDAEISTPMSIGDPANLEDCIAVGSVNADRPYLYGISSFSSRGPTADGRPKPDVVAPGERIRSANAHFADGEPYFDESGTSMAAPHVSGLLAAFLSVRREFRGRPDEVKALLLKTCNDTGRDRYHQGHGVPNLMQMLLAS